jgi:cytochrome c553
MILGPYFILRRILCTMGRVIPPDLSVACPLHSTMKISCRISAAVTSVCLALSATSSLHAASTATLWRNDCAKCHGDDGRGDTKMGRKLLISDLTDAALQVKFSDEEAAKAIKLGLKDAKGKVIMKAISGVSDEDIKGLVAYVRSLKK